MTADHQEASEVYRLDRGVCKNIATENGLYDTTDTIHVGILCQTKYTSAKVPPCCTYANADSSNTSYMPYSQKLLGRTGNKKCLVSETFTLSRTSEAAVK